MHEPLVEHISVKASSDRAFGLVVGAVLGLFGLWRLAVSPDWLGAVLLSAGLVLMLLGVVAPRLLASANRLWLRLGSLLFVVVSPVMMLGVYAIGVLPAGLVMRLLGKDPLRLHFCPEAASYWIERQPPGPKPESMVNQY